MTWISIAQVKTFTLQVFREYALSPQGWICPQEYWTVSMCQQFLSSFQRKWARVLAWSLIEKKHVSFARLACLYVLVCVVLLQNENFEGEHRRRRTRWTGTAFWTSKNFRCEPFERDMEEIHIFRFGRMSTPHLSGWNSDRMQLPGWRNFPMRSRFFNAKRWFTTDEAANLSRQWKWVNLHSSKTSWAWEFWFWCPHHDHDLVRLGPRPVKQLFCWTADTTDYDSQLSGLKHVSFRIWSAAILETSWGAADGWLRSSIDSQGKSLSTKD